MDVMVLYNDTIKRLEKYSSDNSYHYTLDSETGNVVSYDLVNEYGVDYQTARNIVSTAISDLLHNPMSETYKRCVKGWSKNEYMNNINFKFDVNTILETFSRPDRVVDFYEWVLDIIVYELIQNDEVSNNKLLAVVNCIKMIINHNTINTNGMLNKFDLCLNERIHFGITETLEDFVNTDIIYKADPAISMWATNTTFIIINGMFVANDIVSVDDPLRAINEYISSCISSMVEIKDIGYADKEYIENVICMRIVCSIIELLDIVMDAIVGQMSNVSYNASLMEHVIRIVSETIRILYI
jgi:hypothetical protein